MNLIKMAIEKGFQPNMPDFNPNDNWFGVSVYHPDVILMNGSDYIELSLGGTHAGFDKECCQDQFLKKEKDGTFLLIAKRIALYKDNKLFYKSCGGEMPNEQIIINFFKS